MTSKGMIGSNCEATISLQEATTVVAKLRGEHGCSLATIYRWVSEGVQGGIKLDSIKIGGRRVTSLGAIWEFIEATNKVEGGNANTGPRLPSRAVRTDELLRAHRVGEEGGSPEDSN